MNKWNLEKFKKEILKLKPKKRTEVFKKFPYLYTWTKNNKKEREINEFLNKICMSSFEARSLAKTLYTKEIITKKFKKYKTRQELFHSTNGQALISAANRFGIYNQLVKEFKKVSRATSIGEETTRGFLQDIFNEKFLKIRHPNIRNPKTNFPLELDGFCEKLGIAFEYGDHVKVRKESVENVRYRDSFKAKRCKDLKIKLIQVKKEFLSYGDYEKELKEVLLKEFKRLKIKIPEGFFYKKVKIFYEQIPFSKKEIWKKVRKYPNLTKFKAKNPGMNRSARLLGILDDIKVYFKRKQYRLGKSFGFWSEYQNMVKAAKKCKTRTEFHNKYNVAYDAAKKQGIFEELCSHMKNKGHLPYYWTREKILAKAKEYKSLNDFRKNNPGAVTAANRLNIYQEIRKIIKNK